MIFFKKNFVISTEGKDFYKSLFNVVGPIAVQNLISAAVSSTDVIMLSFVGQTAIAAASLAGNIQFILIMIATGLSSGLVMLCAQYWGKKDIDSIRILHGIALRFSLIFGIAITIAAFFWPSFLMRIFTNDENLVEVGSQYIKIVSVSYLCFSITQMFQAGLRSIERVKIVSIITITAFCVNVFLNSVFIFGLFGAPKIGIAGVAIATTVSRIIELVFTVIYSYIQKDVKIRFSNLFKFRLILTCDFLRYSMPALGNELVWGAAFTMYSVIMGHLGEDIVAANSVVGVLRNLGTVVCFGMAYGGAIVLGKTMGSGQMEIAKRNAVRLIKITIFSGILGSLLMYALHPVLPLLADLTPLAQHYSDVLLIINCFSIIGAAINTVLICGIFRAGGDSKFGFIMDVVMMWGISVPLGLISAFVLKLPPLWVYFILYLDEFEKMPVIIIHYFKKKWLKNITRE